MTAIELFHVGVLVVDLEAAISRFSSRLGLTFETPRAIDVVVEEGGTGRARTVRVAYSIEGPPFVELIESQADGLWGRHHGEGLHHVGGWHDDIGLGTGVPDNLATAAIAGGRLGGATGIGLGITAGSTPTRPAASDGARIFRDGELAAIYLPAGDLHGVRVELVVRAATAPEDPADPANAEDPPAPADPANAEDPPAPADPADPDDPSASGPPGPGDPTG